MREKQLSDFERNAECAGAHGGSKRSWQCSVVSGQLKKPEDKSAYARSGYGVTGIKYQEKQSGEGRKDGHVPKVAVPIGPCSEPIWNEPQLAHVRRRREGTDRDGGEQGEREEDEDELRNFSH